MAGFYRLKDLVAPPEAPSQWRLSKREREILVRVAKGMSSEEIGDMLHLSDRTVDWLVRWASLICSFTILDMSLALGA